MDSGVTPRSALAGAGAGRVTLHRLAAHLTRLLDEAARDQDEDATWTRVLVTMVDLQDRNEPPGAAR
jgi:hypothetical protein